MAAIHQQFRSGGSGGERPLPAPPSSPRRSGDNVGPNDNGDHGGQDQGEGGTDHPENVLLAPSESSWVDSNIKFGLIYDVKRILNIIIKLCNAVRVNVPNIFTYFLLVGVQSKNSELWWVTLWETDIALS